MRLIDADELLLILEKEQAYLEKENLLNRSFGIGDAIIELCSAPTIDAVDLIKREDAIDAVEKAKTARSADGEIFCAKINAQMNIQHLPSVQPERRKDEWIEVVRCENCRHDNNCEIQYAAQAGSKFFCAYGERKKNEWLKRTAPTAE